MPLYADSGVGGEGGAEDICRDWRKGKVRRRRGIGREAVEEKE